ncbi:MAG: hypothetical protein WCS55_11635 [Sulfuricurvum sp.]|uniref:hypothetical protein n=1 Tax=Sulfuricurvum sp. TaxID=2025608 RepID=UPI003568FE46
MTLSKSLYTRGIQCSKSLWLKKYSSEVLTPPDATALARFETGNIVGDLAIVRVHQKLREVITS